MAAQNGWIIFQLDVKSTFFHGKLKEDIYVQQPAGFIKKGQEEKVYKYLEHGTTKYKHISYTMALKGVFVNIHCLQNQLGEIKF